MTTTYYQGNRILDQIFGAVSASTPSTLYFALSTTTPNQSGGNITEPSGGSYARASLANNKTSWATASSGSLTNDVEVTFAESTASWGTITYVVIYDALTSGNAMYYDSLSPSRTVASGTTLYFAVSAITVTMT